MTNATSPVPARTLFPTAAADRRPTFLPTAPRSRTQSRTVASRQRPIFRLPRRWKNSRWSRRISARSMAFPVASVVNMITRSGTNKFHGSVYDFVRNQIFDANTWFNDHYGQSHRATEPQQLRLHHWRTDHQEQDVLLLRLRRASSDHAGLRSGRSADRSDACRRFQ